VRDGIGLADFGKGKFEINWFWPNTLIFAVKQLFQTLQKKANMRNKRIIFLFNSTCLLIIVSLMTLWLVGRLKLCLITILNFCQSGRRILTLIFQLKDSSARSLKFCSMIYFVSADEYSVVTNYSSIWYGLLIFELMSRCIDWPSPRVKEFQVVVNYQRFTCN
jgi:hypothetical protein